MDQTLRDAYLARVRHVIAEHGHAVQGALGEDRAADLFYTVGLTGRGLPELVALGLAVDLAHTVLNVAAGELTPGLARGGVMTLSLPSGPARVILAPIPPEGVGQLATVTALYGGQARALQVVLAF